MRSATPDRPGWPHSVTPVSPGDHSNIVERSMRPIVLNQKNALFAGHDQGAENWACVASLIETCNHRAAEDCRSAGQSDGTWRQRGGCLRRSDSVDARLRVFGQTNHYRL